MKNDKLPFYPPARKLVPKPNILTECDPSNEFALIGRANANRKIPSGTIEARVRFDADTTDVGIGWYWHLHE